MLNIRKNTELNFGPEGQSASGEHVKISLMSCFSSINLMNFVLIVAIFSGFLIDIIVHASVEFLH